MVSRSAAVAVLLVAALAAASAQHAAIPDQKQVIYELLASRKNLPNLGSAVMKPNLGLLDYVVDKPVLGRPVAPNLDLLNYGINKLTKPNYAAKLLGPNVDVMTNQWQRAVDAAADANGMKAQGTWSINDMVKALQGSLKDIADTNSTANGTAAAAAPTAPAGPTFTEFASNILCANGLKLANCSGNNPCKGHRCGPASMCMVDQCGGCNAKCVSYLEMGAAANKVLTSVGMKPLLPGNPNAATPNLPVVDKIAKGARDLVQQVLPKCKANSILDLPSLSCKACGDGAVALMGAHACTVCGKGKYADTKSGTCKVCNPGYYSASPAGNRFCSPCAVNTYSNLPGQAVCMPCMGGLGTRGLKAQSRCVRQS
ncbi:MAG: hypothetical protein J3K34DRAFT_418795 [Monoraphidium minutum]|nr:MAG: hypothetical protein J3K34DRAFT_418795 [Monoraphidium minutum]